MKVHTKLKRKYGVTSSFRHNGFHKGTTVDKRKGDKTFKTEDTANAHAQKLGITEFTLEPAKKGKKFKIVC